MTWITPTNARARLCPILERRCVADQCMAWCWEARHDPQVGRCALTAVGEAGAGLTRALALAAAFAPRAGAPMRLALAAAELSMVEGRQHIERAIIASTPPDLPAADLSALLALLADRGPLPADVVGGAGQSPAGGVGNTPPAKCRTSEKANDSALMDDHGALVGGGGPVRPVVLVRRVGTPEPAPPSTGPKILPLPNGTRVKLPDGRTGTVRHQRGHNLGVELDGKTLDDKALVLDVPRRTLEKA